MYTGCPFRRNCYIRRNKFIVFFQVYESVMLWIKHDLSSRRENLPRLLEHVRLPLVKPQFLLDVVETDSIIKNNKVSLEW